MSDTMAQTSSASILAEWPEESREAAQLVVDTYGEPHELTPTTLTWFDVGEWKRVVATRDFWDHEFPAPHFDSVESVVDYRVDPCSATALAEFDGSVVIRRTMGELSATCHDEEANRLALNLAHDIVSGARDVADARAYYAKEFVDARKKLPTPYMEKLRFSADRESRDPDSRVLSDEDLQQAQEQGESRDDEPS